MYEAKGKEYRTHGQKLIMHAYGLKSTPIAQGLVSDINAKHAYGLSSAPIAQGLVYDINAAHGQNKIMHTYRLKATPPSRAGDRYECTACLRAELYAHSSRAGV